MPRYIDADALMEKLNGIWDCNDMTFAPVDGCCIDADCKSCRWRETIEYVKRLVQNQTTISPWHRVEERLPEPFVSVLVQMPGENPFPTVREGYIDKEGQWTSGMFRREPGEVTHWAEMPAPPKEELNKNVE